jgi:hypothetical protein
MILRHVTTINLNYKLLERQRLTVHDKTRDFDRFVLYSIHQEMKKKVD